MGFLTLKSPAANAPVAVAIGVVRPRIAISGFMKIPR
jgi:hypothetical protein